MALVETINIKQVKVSLRSPIENKLVTKENNIGIPKIVNR